MTAAGTADREIVHTRLLDAPRELVFECFTRLEHLQHWWGPAGFSITNRSRDFRVGGTWEFLMHGPDGKDWENLMVFTEIDPPARIAYRHGSPQNPDMFRSEVTFVERDGKTLLTLRAVFPTREERDQVATYAIAGGNSTLDRLTAHLAALATS